MKSLRQTLPNASHGVQKLNPEFYRSKLSKPDSGTLRRGAGHDMNKTEAEFALILEAAKRRGEILRYEYEGITLRWANMRYTPDFLVIYSRGICHVELSERIIMIEVKGTHIWDRDIVRFKGARAYWPEFQFEMHQKTKQEWKQIY